MNIPGLSPGVTLTSVAFGRSRQEDCFKFPGSLNHIERSTYTTEGNSQNQNEEWVNE